MTVTAYSYCFVSILSVRWYVRVWSLWWWRVGGALSAESTCYVDTSLSGCVCLLRVRCLVWELVVVFPEYRRDVATLVLDSGSSVTSVARDLGLGETVVGQWVKIEHERRQATAQGRPDAVVDLIKRLVTVSMRTQELLATLPKLEIPEVQG